MSDATKSSCLNATGRSLELKYLHIRENNSAPGHFHIHNQVFFYNLHESNIFWMCIYYELSIEMKATILAIIHRDWKMCRQAAIEKYLAKCFLRQYCVHHSWEQPNAVSIMPIVLMHSYIAGTRRYHVLCQTCVPNDKVMQANLYIQYLESCFLGKPSRTEICVNVKKPM